MDKYLTAIVDHLKINVAGELDAPDEVDIDDQEDIKLIRNVVCDDEHAYVLANKHRGQIGFYLLKIELANPKKHSTYIINWRNKLDIACCDLYIMKTKYHCQWDKHGHSHSDAVAHGA